RENSDPLLMRALCILSWLVLQLSATSALAASFELGGGPVGVEVPAGWQTAEGMLSVPLTLFGPMRGEERAVLMVYPTGKDRVGMDQTQLEKTYDQFQAGRKDYIAS